MANTKTRPERQKLVGRRPQDNETMPQTVD